MKLTVFLLVLPVAYGLAPPSYLVHRHHSGTSSSTTRLWNSDDKKTTMDMDRLNRAIECAEHYGRCPVDELLELADELEALSGCVLERDQSDATVSSCDKEIQDRKDVAEILRMQSELRLRQEYLKKANLFDRNVHAVHDMEERDEYMEMMDTFTE